MKANSRRAKRLREINPSTTRGTMGSAKQHNLRPIAFEPEKMTVKEIRRKKRIGFKERKKRFRSEQDQIYKDNYIHSVKEYLGRYADKIIELIGELDPTILLKGYDDDPILNIKFISDPLKQAAIAQEVLQHWRDFLGKETTVEDYAEEWDDEED